MAVSLSEGFLGVAGDAGTAINYGRGYMFLGLIGGELGDARSASIGGRI